MITTILQVQPREVVGGEGKSSDEIAYEVADMILERLMDGIDIDKAWASHLKPDKKGRMQSFTTVLFQEVARFNRLLTKVHSSLDNLQKAIKGLVVMSEALEEVFTSCLNNQVPKMWGAVSYPSLKNLGNWIRDLELRLDFISFWLYFGPPASFWISGLFFPQGFLTGALQSHARKYDLPIDQLLFDFEVLPVVMDQDYIQMEHLKLGKENLALYGKLSIPKDGILVHGLFVDAARWDFSTGMLADPNPGEMNPPLPVMLLTPTTEIKIHVDRYVTPLYKTSIRAGVLSTTGHSTNFVIPVLLPTNKDHSYWILKGTALLTMTSD